MLCVDNHIIHSKCVLPYISLRYLTFTVQSNVEAPNVLTVQEGCFSNSSSEGEMFLYAYLKSEFKPQV